MLNKTNKYTRLADSLLGYGGILVADLFKTQNCMKCNSLNILVKAQPKPQLQLG